MTNITRCLFQAEEKKYKRTTDGKIQQWRRTESKKTGAHAATLRRYGQDKERTRNDGIRVLQDIGFGCQTSLRVQPITRRSRGRALACLRVAFPEPFDSLLRDASHVVGGNIGEVEDVLLHRPLSSYTTAVFLQCALSVHVSVRSSHSIGKLQRSLSHLHLIT